MRSRIHMCLDYLRPLIRGIPCGYVDKWRMCMCFAILGLECSEQELHVC